MLLAFIGNVFLFPALQARKQHIGVCMKENIYCWLRDNRYVWMVIFGAIFILSIDFWYWEVDTLVLDFLPIWVLRLVLLQILLSVLIYLFVIFYWRD